MSDPCLVSAWYPLVRPLGARLVYRCARLALGSISPFPKMLIAFIAKDPPVR